MDTSPRPQDTTPAPTITLATIKAVLAKGQAAHPDLAGRMDKAAHILATRSVEPSGDDGRSWWVESETAAQQFYLVVSTPHGPWVCTCKDFERRHDWCKHALAVALLRRCQEAGGTPPPPAPIPFPTERYSLDTRFELTEAGAAYLDTLAASEPAPPAACRHLCPRCHKAHGHAEPCAYPGMPQLCDRCYEREHGRSKAEAAAARGATPAPVA